MNKQKTAKKPVAKKSLTSRSKAIIWLCVVCVFTLAFGFLGLNGTKLDSRGLYKLLPWVPTTNVEAWPKAIPLGLDLRGGVYVEYQADHPEGINETEFAGMLQSTIDVIYDRLSTKGYPESTAVKLGTDGIRVEIPDVTDPNSILDLIGSPAKLEFKTEDGTVFMEGKDIKRAVAGYDTQSNSAALAEAIVQFELTTEGAAIFEKVTGENIGKALGIYLDGELITNPTVQSKISGGSGIINGMGGIEEAQNLATKIQSGALPLVIRQQKVDTVSATLGVDALSTSVLAAIIGILLVMLLMAFRYRLLGLVADWALALYILILFFLIAIVPGIQLTLPGIAGIILGIGMAVDANVIIFERIKEELRKGRSMKAAERAGFKNAMSAIIDSNITTLIAALVLGAYGTGSIQGFATTLFLGVVASMFTAIIVTRFLLRQFVNLGITKPGIYAAVKSLKKEEA